VYGVITHWERDLAAGTSRTYEQVPPVHLLLRGKFAARDALSDEQGRYEMVGVPPGTYELQAIPPAAFNPKYLQRTIELRDMRSCAEADFTVRYDGRISGSVVDADGQPVAGITLRTTVGD
jgi:protocatechuate 3,4-dioxygenase beta subunit